MSKFAFDVSRGQFYDIIMLMYVFLEFLYFLFGVRKICRKDGIVLLFLMLFLDFIHLFFLPCTGGVGILMF